VPLTLVNINRVAGDAYSIRQSLPAGRTLQGPLPPGWVCEGGYLCAAGSLRDLTVAAWTHGVPVAWSFDNVPVWERVIEPGDPQDPAPMLATGFRYVTTVPARFPQLWNLRQVGRTFEARAPLAAWLPPGAPMPAGLQFTDDHVPFVTRRILAHETPAVVLTQLINEVAALGAGCRYDDDQTLVLSGAVGVVNEIYPRALWTWADTPITWERGPTRGVPLPPEFRLGFEAFRGAVRCGFELETQSSNGLTSQSLQDMQGLDQVGYDAAVAARVALQLADPTNWIRLTNLTRLPEAARQEILGLIQARGDQPPADIREAITESVRADYPLRQQFERDSSPAGYFRQLGPDVHAGTDGTVAGFEFRTNGPQEYWQAMRAAAAVFRPFAQRGAGPHVVDTHCSFHIHMSVPALAMQYNAGVQARLMNYILDHLDRVPLGCLRRWQDSGWVRRYFPISLTSAKYSFVSYRGNHRTWEFRCFGNINRLEEAKACIDLAVQAMHYAYSQPPATATPLYNNATTRIDAEIARREVADRARARA
jgi:hypothetical protein